ncbi:MAG: metallophosphoesterase [Bacillota bacterium]|nr:metallophosphoesterase [Bacillota bacterium]
MKKRIIYLLILSLILFLNLGIYFNTCLRVTFYNIQTNISKPIRIVQLSDLHSAQFGKENEELIQKIKDQSPDLIVMTGDMFSKDHSDIQVSLDLIKVLSSMYSVYYGYGNHEANWIGKDLKGKLEQAGAIVLDRSYVDVVINDTSIRIGGYEGYYGTPHMNTKDEKEQEKIRLFMKDFEETDSYKILLNHVPTSWVDWNYIDTYPVDLVFSGHYHGGLIQIPFVNRGLYAPYVGWFPKNCKGMYVGKKATCVLSGGLGNHYSIPRINNAPEIVVVDLY